MLRIFAQFELEKIAKYFKTRTSAKTITGLLFLAVFLVVGIGIYSFFVSGFRYIFFEAPEDARQALFLFLYELFLVILSGIIVISAMVSGIFNLFQKGDNNWFISSPSFAFFPKLVLMRSIMTSLLPSAVMFIPAILALRHVYHISLLGMAGLLISIGFLLITLNALSLLFIVAVGKVYYVFSQKIHAISFSFKGYIILLTCIIISIVGFLWSIFSRIDLVALFKAEDSADPINIATIGDHFAFLPTHHIALQTLAVQNGGDALFNLLVVATIGAVSAFLWLFFSKTFYPLWQKFQEGSSQSQTSVLSFVSGFRYEFQGGRVLALFKKEALIFTRNFKGMLWFLFLFAIWLMQIATSVLLRHNIHKYETDISQKVITLEAIQFIIAIYFINAFVLRFVFPAFSVEKKTAWILKSAPLSFKKMFFGKYFFYTIFFSVLGVIMGIISMSVLGLPFAHALYSIFLFLSTVVFIVTLGLSLGALYPSYETDDPEAISTSLPGLFFTAVSLIYGAFSTRVLYLSLTKGNSFFIILFVLATIALSALLLAKTPAWAKNKGL